MERIELDQYRGLYREIKYLEEKVKRMPKEVSVMRGSSPYFPCPERRSRMEGPGKEEKALRKALYQRRTRCLEMKHRIYHSIDNIADSRIRLVFELRCIDGWSRQKISMYMSSFHEPYARKIHDRYLEKK